MKKVLDARIIVGLIGLFLSVALHELFHIIMHWNNIESIQFFPNSGTIMEVISKAPENYNVMGEEAIAYTITILTIIITTLIIFRIHDQKDTRSFSQTVAHKANGMPEEKVFEWYKSYLLGQDKK